MFAMNIIFSGKEHLQCRITFLSVNKVQLTNKNPITYSSSLHSNLLFILESNISKK